MLWCHLVMFIRSASNMYKETKIALGEKGKETVSMRLRKTARDSNTESVDREEHVVIDWQKNIQHFKITLKGHERAQRTAAKKQLLSSTQIQLQTYELIPLKSAELLKINMEVMRIRFWPAGSYKSGLRYSLKTMINWSVLINNLAITCFSTVFCSFPPAPFCP